jgi:hypothetical protein
MTDAGRLSLLAVLGALGLCGAAPGADDAREERLRAMPRERRLYLAEKLKEFDGLDKAERDSVRELDRRVSALPEEDRANYYTVLHRYHLWLQSLPEAQRNEINAKPPSERMTIVSRVIKDQASRAPASPPFFQIADVGGVSPFNMANQAKIWLALPNRQKEEVARLPEQERQQQLRKLGGEFKVKPIPRPTKAEEDAIESRALKGAAFPALKRFNDEATKPAMKKRMLEHYYFLEHPPARVSTENLVRFTAALPPWLRTRFDPLPPDEARRRLSILYRLIYPQGSEYQEPKPETPTASAPPKAGTPPGPGPAPPASTKPATGTGTSPF